MTQDPTTIKGQGFDIIVPGTATRVPMVTVVYHDDPKFLGQRLVLDDGANVVLGRSAPCFERGTLDDGRISRSHLALSCVDGVVTAADRGSSNGSFRNGEPLLQEVLQPCDVIAIGGVMLLFHRGERTVAAMDDGDVVATSASMIRALAQASMVAHRSVTVLLQGPTGVGKEVVARELHKQSERKGTFVALNCGGVGDGVLHSELFGHTRGAFSGADKDRTGLVEEARDGTLFLDEVGDASTQMQASLLRLLEQREYRQVGDNEVRKSNARFVAATHVPLKRFVERGAFREDLYSRLSRWTIDIPALRDRPDDIIPLARHFAHELLKRDAKLSPSLTLALLRYDWPSNVRELSAVIEQAVIESGQAEVVPLTESVAARLEPSDRPSAEALAAAAFMATARETLPAGTPREEKKGTAKGDSAKRNDANGDSTKRNSTKRDSTKRNSTKRNSVERPTADELKLALIRTSGNMRKLADKFGVNRSTLYRWAKELELDIKALRDALD
jgi:DNA-binding NtrC family response regulator